MSCDLKSNIRLIQCWAKRIPVFGHNIEMRTVLHLRVDPTDCPININCKHLFQAHYHSVYTTAEPSYFWSFTIRYSITLQYDPYPTILLHHPDLKVAHNNCRCLYKLVFRIRIRIYIFLGFTDPDLSSSKNKKNLDSYCFVTSFGIFIFEK
jgi:hypothetical protein